MTPGYCLWLLPPLDAAKPLRDLIFNLSKGAGSPAFMPHITLLAPRGPSRADPDALETALHRGVNDSMLVRDMQSDAPGLRRGDARGADPEAYDRAGEAAEPGLRLRLGEPQAGDRYYQCVLTPVDPASAAGLVALRSAVAAHLGEKALPFFPHLSLCYGDFNAATKDEIAASAAKAQWPREISCTEAAVVDVNGTADQWRIVTMVKLT